MRCSLSFFFLFLIMMSLLYSGCVEREKEIELYISKVDVMSTPQDEGSKLTVTVYVSNQQDKDTGALSIKVKARDPQTNLVVAEQSKDIGYIKANSQVTNTVSLTVSKSGEQIVEAELFENNVVVDEYGTDVAIVNQDENVPSSVVLTDMVIEMQQVTNYGKDAVVDISPGVYNPGGNSGTITMEVTAAVDPYTTFTGTDTLESIKAGERIRGNIRMTLPLDKVYTFNVQLMENGVVIGDADAAGTVTLKDMKIKQPVTYNLAEAEAPIEEPAGTPGFSAPCSIVAVAFAVLLMGRRVKKK